MRVLSIVGTRPQFIKAAVLSAELRRRGIDEVLVHTGQHYDAGMSDVFFEELPLPIPAYRLGVGSGPHGEQTGEMLKRLEPVLANEEADWAIVFGDTNSTLAGALAAVKLGVPLAHVEAGLRSFNREMPEEINRIVVDRISTLLLAPNAGAARQLRSEGSDPSAIEIVGDLQLDLAESVAAGIGEPAAIVRESGLAPGSYGVLTVHRPANTDDHVRFGRLLDGVRRSRIPVVFPVHPRTRAIVQAAGAGEGDNIILCDPLPYREMIALLKFARILFTDSGGLQKEAFQLRVPCTTLRDETEWVETLEDGWNVLTGSDAERIAASALRPLPQRQGRPYGEGSCARSIGDALLRRTLNADSRLCAS